jgi:hypothetical protein
MKRKGNKLYWVKKKGKFYLIGANDFSIMDQGRTMTEAKEMFLENMIIMYGDLLDRVKIEADGLNELHRAYSQFDDLKELDEE